MATKLQKSMLQPIAVIYKFVTAVRPGLGGAMRVASSCPSRATAARERLPARAQSPNARLPTTHLTSPRRPQSRPPRRASAQKTKVQIWLFEQTSTRLEGKVLVSFYRGTVIGNRREGHAPAPPASRAVEATADRRAALPL
jgi:hypothetical protein